MKNDLRAFLQRYVGSGPPETDEVKRDDIEMFLFAIEGDALEQDIMAYALEHPDEPFWELLKFIKPGLAGVTQEELLLDDE